MLLADLPPEAFHPDPIERLDRQILTARNRQLAARAQHDRETEHQAEKFLNRLLEVRALIASNRAKAKAR